MDTLDFRIDRLLLKSGSALNNLRAKDLKSYDLTASQSETILFFAAHTDKNIRDLADHLLITHQAARKLVEKLKEKDILATTESPEDRRSVRVGLTDHGRQLCVLLKGRGASLGANLLREFTVEEKKQLLNYLEKIEKNI